VYGVAVGVVTGSGVDVGGVAATPRVAKRAVVHVVIIVVYVDGIVGGVGAIVECVRSDGVVAVVVVFLLCCWWRCR